MLNSHLFEEACQGFVQDDEVCFLTWRGQTALVSKLEKGCGVGKLTQDSTLPSCQRQRELITVQDVRWLLPAFPPAHAHDAFERWKLSVQFRWGSGTQVVVYAGRAPWWVGRQDSLSVPYLCECVPVVGRISFVSAAGWRTGAGVKMSSGYDTEKGRPARWALMKRSYA